MAKKIFDIVFAITGLVLLAPLFIAIAIIIKLDSIGPVFFRQERVGQNGRIFKIYKFRTMATLQSSEALKITVGADRRITKSGAILRKYKIDELPQLINILKGEMSFVGPRPEVAEYVKYYSDMDRAVVLSVKPGITDWASLKFKDENDILAKEENPEQAYINKILPIKLRYYRFYVKKRSVYMDIVIILQTIMAVVR